jgi:hypothetical protein
VQGLTPTASPVCTRVCTSEPETDNAGTFDANQGDQGDKGEGIDQAKTAPGAPSADQGDPLAKLADALRNLSPDERTRLAIMLAGQ